MKRVKEIWDDWVTVGDDGCVNGIQEEAPEEVKAAYERYLKEIEEQKTNGLVWR